MQCLMTHTYIACTTIDDSIVHGNQFCDVATGENFCGLVCRINVLFVDD